MAVNEEDLVASHDVVEKRGAPRHNLCCSTEAGSYLRLIDSCITQRKAQGPSRTCNESKEEEEAQPDVVLRAVSPPVSRGWGLS